METEKTFYLIEQFDENGFDAGTIILREEEGYLWYVNGEKADYPDFTFRVTTLKAVAVETL